jgi:hypothetical protein
MHLCRHHGALVGGLPHHLAEEHWCFFASKLAKSEHVHVLQGHFHYHFVGLALERREASAHGRGQPKAGEHPETPLKPLQ